jgi:tetratricopeptide (TPR) repeat protein
MAEVEYPEELKKRAREFFSKGSEVAYALNYDYAIEIFLDGLSSWPDALEEGHKLLREIALRRQAAGGKKSGFGDSSKYKKNSGKTAKDQMLKAEYLWCKDPSNIKHMTEMIKAAVEGNYTDTSLWTANMVVAANRQKDKPSVDTYVLLRDCYYKMDRQKDKPSVDTYVLLRDCYYKMEQFSLSLQACQQALLLKPGDLALSESMRDLSAQATMQQGKYDEEGDFRDSIKDRDEQEKLQSQEALIRTKDTQDDIIAAAYEEYNADPKVPGKINKLVDALCQSEQTDKENEAIEILENAYTDSNQFRYKQRGGNIKIKQLNRSLRELHDQFKQDTGNELLKHQIQETSREVLQTEMDHYKLCTKNYPTDLGLKQEYGKRLLRAKRYDDAIPFFQESRSDPRFRISALNFTGKCFFYKEWYTDAVETFQQALESVESNEGAVAKELRYNLGRAYESDEQIEEALKCYRKVAQIDFNYLDVKTRIDTLRQQERNGQKKEKP